ncbi:hypothetical protein IWQ61_007811 [Dispira simplex]|nr:hypothetical protein IWQ61_007811 [Dispira simplex]
MKAALTNISSIGLILAALYATPIQADCLAEDVVDICVINASANFNGCSFTDYSCRCNAQRAIADCYTNCPDEDDQIEAATMANIYCNQMTAEISRTVSHTTSKPTESVTTTSYSSPITTTTLTNDDLTTRSGTASRATSTSNVNGLDIVDDLNGSQIVAPSSMVALTGMAVLAAYVMM